MYINEYLLGKWLSREKFVYNHAPITQIHQELSFEHMFSYALLPGKYSQSTQHNWYNFHFIYQCAFYLMKYLAKLISAGIGSM